MLMAMCRTWRTFAHIQRKDVGDKLPWGDRIPDVYGPHHACASYFFLGSLHSAIRGVTERNE